MSGNTGRAGTGGIVVTGCSVTGASVTPNNWTISGNTSRVNDGGGLFVQQGCNATLTLNNSAAGNNRAGMSGGSMYNANGTLTIDATSAISDNHGGRKSGPNCSIRTTLGHTCFRQHLLPNDHRRVAFATSRQGDVHRAIALIVAQQLTLGGSGH